MQNKSNSIAAALWTQGLSVYPGTERQLLGRDIREIHKITTEYYGTLRAAEETFQDIETFGESGVRHCSYEIGKLVKCEGIVRSAADLPEPESFPDIIDKIHLRDKAEMRFQMTYNSLYHYMRPADNLRSTSTRVLLTLSGVSTLIPDTGRLNKLDLDELRSLYDFCHKWHEMVIVALDAAIKELQDVENSMDGYIADMMESREVLGRDDALISRWRAGNADDRQNILDDLLNSAMCVKDPKDGTSNNTERGNYESICHRWRGLACYNAYGALLSKNKKARDTLRELRNLRLDSEDNK